MQQRPELDEEGGGFLQTPPADERSSAIARDPERQPRIGLIAVHGIGDQGRFQFLDDLVRDLQRGFEEAAEPGARVSVHLNNAEASLMGAAAPTLAEGPGPSIEIVVAQGERRIRIGVHEVWWGDIVDPKTLMQPLKFLAWGLAMWAVPLKHRRGLDEQRPGSLGELLAEPVPVEGLGRAAVALVRAKLFFVGYLVTVVGAVLRLLVGVLRAVTRQNLPDPVMTAISYMSDIKLYTQATSPEAVPLDHLGQHARFAIRARLLRALSDVALQNYDRWWVLAHSLGSVVAFSGLTAPDGLIARYLDDPRWRRLQAVKGMVYRDEARVPKDTAMPAPAWLEPDACVAREALLERFAGLVTYGSPLDKFAMLWPAVVPNLRDQGALGRGVWLNFYEGTDPVAGHLDAFDRVGEAAAAFRPENHAYAAHRLPLYSHLRYLSTSRGRRGDARDSLSARLAAWWLSAVDTPQGALLPAFAGGTGRRWPSAGGARARQRFALVFWIVVALLGPAITAGTILALYHYDLLGRIGLGGWQWPAWLPHGFWGLFVTVVVVAVAIVTAAGVLGRLLAFSTHDVNPEARKSILERLQPAEEGEATRPAVKDTAPYG